MNAYQHLLEALPLAPKTWTITGVAGFIGSNLLERLLTLNQRVVGLDNFETGHQRNLDEVRSLVTQAQWKNFNFVSGDIRNSDHCKLACHGADYILHQAALGSVPRSLEDPVATNANNITGFLNILVAARDAGVKRFIYAASSSTYGDHPGLPKIEGAIGKPLSPYAVTKYVNELYAEVFARCYQFQSTGLRYFNVFGPRQDPLGAYAAVIPKWIVALIRGDKVLIHGDGETSRDFCFVTNIVQANLLAATTATRVTSSDIYNVALGDRTTLNATYELLRDSLAFHDIHTPKQPLRGDFRPGDVRHSQADISKAERNLGYAPTHRLAAGIAQTVRWYLEQEKRDRPGTLRPP